MSDKEVEPPNYSWLKASSDCTKTQRAELDIVKSDSSPSYQGYQVFKQAFGGCFCSPVSSQLTSGARVLYTTADSLEWVKDVSSIYPNSDYECVTVKNSASRSEDLPEKIKYNFWNVEKKTLYPDSVFDFIYVESLIIHLRTEEWSNFLRELFRILKPGGFLELQEADVWSGSMGPTTEVFCTTIVYSLRARGVNTKAGRELENLLKNTGFTNITKYHVSVPCGWGSPLGEAYGQLSNIKLKQMVPFIMKSLGWTEDRVSEEVEKIDKENIEYQTYSNIHKAYAQKP